VQANHVVSMLLSSLLAACAAFSPQNPDKSHPPQQKDSSTISQIAKTDFDRMADVEIRENIASLRTLMVKLYKRNPQELKKSTSGTIEEMVTWVFEGKHNWDFEEISHKKEAEAIFLSFNPDYQGDRVLSYIVGLQTMLIKAHGGKQEFYLPDSIDPQKIYHFGRNVEIAAWKLSNARHPSGQLYLLTNEINENDKNLSFEREFGKMIGRTDAFAILLAEKSQRFISRVMQNLATAVFFPI
jgi:hypothetical protein